MNHEHDPAGRTAAPREHQLPSLLKVAEAHYRAGRLVKAEAQCNEILQLAPEHSEALQVLGMIAIQTGRYDAALLLIERVLAKDPANPIPYFDLGNVLERLQRNDEAVASYRKAVSLNPKFADAHFNLGVLFEKRGALDASAAAYRSTLALNPADADAHSNLANVLHQQGRLPDAIDAVRAAVRLAPRKAMLHYNLANMLRDHGQFDAAVASYREALELDPRNLRAAQNLALVLKVQGDEDGVVECHQRIVALDPASAAAQCDLGDALSQQGRFDVALACYVQAVTLDSSEPRYQAGFARCVRNVQFTGFDRPISELLTRAVSEPWARPAELMKICCDLISLMPGIRELVDRGLTETAAPLATLAWFGDEGLEALGHAELLHAALRNAPVCTLGLERVLTRLRTVLLGEADKPAAGSLPGADANPRLLALYSALAEQCYINEYVFFGTVEEDARIQALRDDVAGRLAEGADIPVLSLLALAAYEPLGRLAGAERLLDRQWPDTLSVLLQRQVAEPRDEASRRARIESVTSIAGGVSEQVRQQYEENPYPRWIRAAPAADAAVSVEMHARRLFPSAAFDDSVSRPPAQGAVDVLVAGCGTGQEPIELARQIAGARILAVDLSLASLAYAQRKTSELNLSNVEYAQADINLLGALDRRFDFIESFGVLHHLADPVAGWRTLLSLLRPGGRMAVGLYSEQARVAVVAARDYIARHGYSATQADIRRARQDLMQAAEPGLSETLASFRDFFTTSECRDLLFHVQEHRFTLAQIEEAIAELGVRFLGFLVPPSIRREYSRRFPDDREQTDLRHWAEFEAEFPYTFLGMYGFWVEKPGVQSTGFPAAAMPNSTTQLH
jgi:tetratricopeptide (TPR) repeat protein